MDERVFKRGFTDRIKYETETELRPIPGPLFSFSPFFSLAFPPPPPWIFIEILHTQRLFFFFFFERNPIPTNQSFRHAGGIKFLYPGNIVPFSYFYCTFPATRARVSPSAERGGEGRGGDKYARTGIHASGAFPFRFLSRFSLTRASIYSRILNPLPLPPPISLPWTSREGGDAGGRW